MCGLDVTHAAQIMDEDVGRIRAIDNPVAQCVAELLEFFVSYHKDPKWGLDGAPLHDPCTIAWLLEPDMFSGIDCHVAIETQSELTMGMTVVDRYQLTGKPANAHVLLGIDRQRFVDLLTNSLKIWC